MSKFDLLDPQNSTLIFIDHQPLIYFVQQPSPLARTLKGSSISKLNMYQGRKTSSLTVCHDSLQKSLQSLWSLQFHLVMITSEELSRTIRKTPFVNVFSKIRRKKQGATLKIMALSSSGNVLSSRESITYGRSSSNQHMATWAISETKSLIMPLKEHITGQI